MQTSIQSRRGLVVALSLAAAWLCAVNRWCAAEEPAAFAAAARVLVARCLGCHNASEANGNLNLASAESLLTGGDGGPAVDRAAPGESLLWARIAAGEMPPPEKAAALSAEDAAALQNWIATGAPWPEGRTLSADEITTDRRAGRDWWSLQPPQRPAIPAVDDPTGWGRGAIDALIAARREAQHLPPAPEASRATLLRRLKFDLLGLPPTPEEMAEFAADPAPEAYERLVDRWLASPHFGERWGRHWLDVVRYADSHGFEMNNPRPNAWPYRDWVIAALNADLPYDQFVLAQLAGDQIGADPATGFLVAGAWDQVKSPDPVLTAQQRMDELADMVGVIGTAFLGLSTGCARCHDHKFDPISQHDFYALQAAVSGVQHGERAWHSPDEAARQEQIAALDAQIAALARQLDETEPLAAAGSSSDALRVAVTPTRNVERFAPVVARRVRMTILATNNGSQPCLDELEIYSADDGENVALAAAGARATASGVFDNGANPIHQLAHVNDGKYGNGRSWISAQAGGGWVQIELPAAMRIDRVVWGRDRERKFTDRVATQYRIEISPAESGDEWRLAADASDRTPQDAASNAAASAGADPARAALVARRADCQTQRDRLAASGQVYAGRFESPAVTHRLHRGDPMQPREPVPPGTVTALDAAPTLALDASDAQRRLALGRWLGDSGNPLAARVAVNRIWRQHFGRGLVETPGDFGWHGGRPSHPELLDWLALELRDHGWSTKHLHRLMLTSAAYRQSGRAHDAALKIDADNRLLWRMAPRRLEAEPLRDAMLAVSGQLDLRAGGPGYDAFEPNDNYVRVYVPRSTWGPAQFRRMVYQHVPRMRFDGTFGAFDCPDGGQTMPKRNVSTTALQAVNLLNSPFVVQQAELFAARLAEEVPDDEAAQTARAFSLALGRDPGDDERQAAAELLRQHGLPALCRALYNSNEFLYVD